MALREFLAQHRIASAVAAPAVLGIAAIVAASFAVTDTPRKADTTLVSSVTECHDMVTISVAGRNDTPREGTTAMLVDANGNPLPAALSGDHSSEWLDPVINAPKAETGEDYAAVYIAYPANMDSYEDAVNTGVANTQQVMQQIAAACPDTKFSIVGYSEGADVVRRVAMGIGNDDPADGYSVVNPDDVLGVVILADAGRQAGEGPFPGAVDPNRPDNFDPAYQTGNGTAPGQGALPGTSGSFGKLNGKVASFCSEGDLTCAAPQNISLLQLAANVGRQLDVDSLQAQGLTEATGGDVAMKLGQIAMLAFSDIASQPNWMASDETFLQVLLRVSDPAYKPGQQPVKTVAQDSITQDQLSPIAYLPQKIFNEIVGLIVTNQNTIPVIMSDPYQLTLGPNKTGHHFDYWRDSDPANGKPLTSAEYAAAWLTHLAKEAQAGRTPDTRAKPEEQDLADARAAAAAVTATPTATPTTTAKGTTTTAKPTTTTKPGTTTTAPKTTTTTPPVTTTPKPVDTQAEAPKKETTTTAPAEPKKVKAETPAETTTPAPTTTVTPTTTPAPTTTATPATP
ncbi:cutinase family protein [Nocardia thailandica]|uniref:cutinase family protein n=1 Tax=Nocardia thailandica TaxID=257275 RepID=UPI0003009708|nr:cutinase family protein [Nocardia thailandica]